MQIMKKDTFPMVDYHVHLKGGLTLEQAKAWALTCGLTPADMFVPKPDGEKAIQRKPLPKRKY